ncbi:hypothetical protein U737_19925 [Methylomonas sp. LW13]|uniref:hypothetical protein n=1 Tax=unclassified Methylomonas TaxID=2608980 RepID=UPI00051C5AC4|nr:MULTISPECIES: hypothetical protein [unclassified Methylomonas]PKD40542.1 hypothetical protein CWO84_09690 [Methylomonas sp. Kb3]QBC28989.1 hypothetical protein U737_19925 [Methylomonas sp. LW13]
MSLQARLSHLENLHSINPPKMPEGLSPMEQYLWMVRQPATASEKPVNKTSGLSPEEAYTWMLAA